LLLRVDALPVSLTLAQAIEESGWGTSRYARDGNALFGQRTWRATGQGMTARKDGKALDHRALAFADLMQSVRAYMHNLNTHRSYRKFRAERQRMREAGELIDGGKLAGFLGSYAENEGYVANLRRLIRHNELDAYESARLASGAVAEALWARAERNR
jgi:Bax protein